MTEQLALDCSFCQKHETGQNIWGYLSAKKGDSMGAYSVARLCQAALQGHAVSCVQKETAVLLAVQRRRLWELRQQKVWKFESRRWREEDEQSFLVSPHESPRRAKVVQVGKWPQKSWGEGGAGAEVQAISGCGKQLDGDTTKPFRRQDRLRSTLGPAQPLYQAWQQLCTVLGRKCVEVECCHVREAMRTDLALNSPSLTADETNPLDSKVSSQ